MPANELRGAVRHPGGLHHRFGYVAIDLDSHRRFILPRAHLRKGLVRIADQPVGRDEFGIYGGSPLLSAQNAEGCVGDVFHRCQ